MEGVEGVTAAPDLGPFQDMWDAWEEVRDILLQKPLSHFRTATDIQFDELAQHQDAGDHAAAAREMVDIISVALNLMRSLGYTSAEIADIARARATWATRATRATAPDLGPFQDMWDAGEEPREKLLQQPLSHFRKATDIHFDELEHHRERLDDGAAARKAVDIIGVALNLMRSLGYTSAEIADIARARAARRMKGQTTEILDKYQNLYNI